MALEGEIASWREFRESLRSVGPFFESLAQTSRDRKPRGIE